MRRLGIASTAPARYRSDYRAPGLQQCSGRNGNGARGRLAPAVAMGRLCGDLQVQPWHAFPVLLECPHGVGAVELRHVFTVGKDAGA